MKKGDVEIVNASLKRTETREELSKPIIKAQISGKLVSSGICDVAIASVHSEKNPSEEVDDYDNHYYK